VCDLGLGAGVNVAVAVAGFLTARMGRIVEAIRKMWLVACGYATTRVLRTEFLSRNRVSFESSNFDRDSECRLSHAERDSRSKPQTTFVILKTMH
jgi:hypothetical protein